MMADILGGPWVMVEVVSRTADISPCLWVQLEASSTGWNVQHRTEEHMRLGSRLPPFQVLLFLKYRFIKDMVINVEITCTKRRKHSLCSQGAC